MTNETTLGEGRTVFQRALLLSKKATHCPLCSRRAHMRHRKLNSGMARMLVELFIITRDSGSLDGWIHVQNVFLKRGQAAIAKEYSKLPYWGLLEVKPGTNPEVRGTGEYRLTVKGLAFLEDEIRIPRTAYVLEPGFEEVVVGFSEETTSIREALPDAFDYDELMGRS